MSAASRRFLTGLRVGLLAALALAVVVSSITHTTGSGGSPLGSSGRLIVDTSRGSELHRISKFSSGIVGNVSIINPFLMCAGPVNPLPRPDVKTQLVVADSSAGETIVPVNWYEIFNCGSVLGSFKTSLLPGKYFITLSNCSENSTNPGCDQLPMKLTVGRRGMTQVILDIEQKGWVAQGNLFVGTWKVTLRVFPPAT